MASRLFRALDFATTPPSVANLTAALTINSVTNYPSMRYKGGDANGSTWAKWTYGENLTWVTGTNWSAENMGSPLLGSVDDSVQFAGGGSCEYYQDQVPGTFDDIGTNDVVLEVVCRVGNGGGSVMGNAWTAAAAGWEVGIDGGTRFTCGLRASSAVSVISDFLDDWTWYHAMCFLDRSGSGQWYVNGAASGSAVSIASQSASITSTTAFVLGARPGSIWDHMEGNIAYVAMWQGSAWLDTHLQATVAKDRFHRMLGLYPNEATGTADVQLCTRASTQFSEKFDGSGNKKVFLVGDNWLPASEVKDTGGTTHTGLWFEDIEPNKVPVPYTVNDLGWAKNNCTASVSSSNPSPFLRWSTVATYNHGTVSESSDGSAQSHYFYRSVGGLSATTYYEVMVLIKNLSAARNYFRLLAGDHATSPSDYGAMVFRYDAGQGAVDSTTEGGSCTVNDGRVENWGDGWYRCSFNLYVPTAETYYYRLDLMDSGKNLTYQGDGREVCDPAFMQLSAGRFRHAINGGATPATSTLRYKMDDGNLTDVGPAQVRAKLWLPTNQDQSGFLWFNDGGSTSNCIEFGVLYSSDYLNVTGTVGGSADVDVDGTSDIADGDVHEVFATWATGGGAYNRVGVDEVVETTSDSEGDMPPNIDNLDVGTGAISGALQGGIVFDIQIYSDDSLTRELSDAVSTSDSASTVLTLGPVLRSASDTVAVSDDVWVEIDDGSRPRFRVFDVETTPPGVDNLSATLTINGISETPSLRYRGGDADGTDWNYWGYGGDLTLQSGTAPTYGWGSPLLGTSDDSVLFNAGGYYRDDAAGTFDNVGTDDHVWEMVFCSGPLTASRILFSNWDQSTPGGAGVECGLYGATTDVLYFLMLDSDEYVSIATDTALSPWTWYHVMVFVDFGGSAILYLNAVEQTASSVAALESSMDGSSPFSIGNTSGGATVCDAAVAYLAMWHRASWLDTHLQATVAKQRFYDMTRLTADSATGDPYPGLYMRTSQAHLEKFESGSVRPYCVGRGWPRISQLKDSGSTVRTGYLTERSGTQLQQHSFDTNAWDINTNLTCVLNATGPNAIPNRATTITESTDGSPQVHYCQELLGSVTAQWYEVILIAKCVPASGRDDIYFAVIDTISRTSAHFFDFKNGVVGTEVELGGWTTEGGRLEDWGDGYYRMSFYMLPDAPATGYMQIVLCDSSEGATYQGDGRTVCEVAYAGCVAGHYRHSVMETYGDVCNQAGDIIRYWAPGNIKNASACVSFSFLGPSYDLKADHVLFDAIDLREYPNSYMRVLAEADTDVANLVIRENSTTTVDIDGSTDIIDGAKRDILAAWNANYARLAVNGTTEAQDASVKPVDGLDRFYIGNDAAGFQQPNALIWNFQVDDQDTLLPEIEDVVAVTDSVSAGLVVAKSAADSVSVTESVLVERWPPTQTKFSALTFETAPPSVANLNPILDLDGSEVTASLRYKGGDANGSTWAKWGYGGDLTLKAGTAPSYNQGAPLLGSGDDSVLFNYGGYYNDDAGGTFDDIGTDDFVLEAVFRTNEQLAAWRIFASTTGPTYGWYMGQHTGYIYVGLTDTIGGAMAAFSQQQDPYVWLHVLFFARRASYGTFYINGTLASGNHDISSYNGSLDGSSPFQMGAYNSGTYLANQTVAYFAMWHQADWLSTSEHATFARERFHALLSTGALIEDGGWTIYPTFTRASPTYVEKYESDGSWKPYRVADNWPAISQAEDNGGQRRTGYHSEWSGTNTIDDSFDLTNWSIIDQNLTPALDATGPDGIAPLSSYGGASTLTESVDGGEVYHYVESWLSTPATGWYECCWILRHLGNGQPWARIAVRNGAWSNYVYVFVRYDSSAAIGTESASGTMDIDAPTITQLGNTDWYRFSMFVNVGTQESLYNHFVTGDGDLDDLLLQGDGDDICEVWHVHFVPRKFRHHPVPKFHARALDALTYDVTGHVSPTAGLMRCRVLGPNINLESCDPTVLRLSDGGGVNDFIELRYDGTSDYAAMLVTAGGVAQAAFGGTTDAYDGNATKLAVAWESNLARLDVDDVQEGIDSSVTVPSGLDLLQVGADENNYDQFYGLIWDIALFYEDAVREPEDSVSVAETLALEADYVRSPSDVIGITDEIGADLYIRRDLSDAVVVTEVLAGLIVPEITTPPENTKLSGSSTTFGWTGSGDIGYYWLNVWCASVGFVAQTGWITDHEYLVTGIPTTGETITASVYYWPIGFDYEPTPDIANYQADTQGAASDTVSVSDSVNRVFDAARVLSDAAVVSDSTARVFDAVRVLSDAAVVSDSVSVSVEQQKFVSETVSASDTAVRSGTFERRTLRGVK